MGAGAGYVHGIHLCDVKAGIADQTVNGPVDMAAAGEFAPHRINPGLPAPDVRIRCQAMFAKQQLCTGF